MKLAVRPLTLSALTLALAGVAVPSFASAATVDTSGCGTQVFTQALSVFGDTNLYGLAPQGSFEGVVSGWTVNGTAKVVADPAFPTGPVADKYSLEIAAGTKVISPPICANTSTPGFRLFMKAPANSVPNAATVDVGYLSTSGADVHKAALIKPTAGAWGLTAVVQVDTTKIALDSTGWGRIRIAVVAPGNTAMRIDDLYVDPKMR
ncbi:MAG: hypothetical protein U0Y82_09535 [Thermoleophilia bacterium]